MKMEYYYYNIQDVVVGAVVCLNFYDVLEGTVNDVFPNHFVLFQKHKNTKSNWD